MSNDDTLRRLIDGYRALAATVPAATFIQRVKGDGATRIEAMIVLRDLYGYDLLECEQIVNESEAKPANVAPRIGGR